MQGFSLEKLVKKVQGAIPVVSLLSKLLSPEGGIGSESLSYNELIAKVKAGSRPLTITFCKLDDGSSEAAPAAAAPAASII